MATYAIMTNVGRNKEAAAMANGTALAITEIAWGDGDRSPGGGETALLNEVGRKAIQGTGQVSGALNTAYFEILLDENEGPFTVKEAGLFDDDGDMIAVARYDPPINKPTLTISVLLRIQVVFSDLENLVLQVEAANLFAPAARKILTGDGLQGGGDLSQDRMLSVDVDRIAEIAQAAANALLDGAPEALDTLNELAAALGDDPNFAATVLGQIGAAAPVGAVAAFAASSPPTGWLECDGAAISRTTYDALFAAIGDVFGEGDGSTTFELPDLRGEFIRGWDHGRGVDGGRAFGGSQSDQLKSHTHDLYGDGNFDWTSGNRGGVDGSSGPIHGTSAATGGSETRPRNVALMFCVKY